MAETRQYHVVPITPVFVGTGTSLGPEEYYIDEKAMVRFSTAKAIAVMREGERKQLEKFMDGAGMVEGIQMLREVARREASTTLYRLPVGDECLERLRSLSRTSDQAIQTMPHTLENGHGYIPGTAIKGAIRTAVLSGWLQQQPGLLNRYQREIWAEGTRLPDSRKLEAEILGGGQMESDPFRYLSVRDVSIHPREMRVDSFFMVDREGRPKGDKIAMFGERLACAVEGKPTGSEVEVHHQGRKITLPTAGTVEISIEADKRRDERVKRIFGATRSLDFKEQAALCRHFYLGRLQAERRRFPSLYKWFDPVIESLIATTGVFLRIGRHSHFESASLDGIRKGSNVQLRMPIREGSTRTTCSLKAGSDRTSMGWVLLLRA